MDFAQFALHSAINTFIDDSSSRVGFQAAVKFWWSSVCNYYMVDSVSGESQEGGGREGGGGKCPDGTVHPSSWWRSSSCALLHGTVQMHLRISLSIALLYSDP